MHQAVVAIGIAALLGSALVGGIFFAFSSFVMKALARLPGEEGIAAMQSINVVVINASFVGVFIGTTLLSLGSIGIAIANWGRPSAYYFLAGSLCFLFGTLLVTGLGNVPLNDKLAVVSPTDSSALDLWQLYLAKWTMWNHVRTAAAMVAALLFALGLLQYGST